MPIYLNHAGTSWPKPAAVPQAIAAALEAGPSCAADLFAASREVVCRFLGVQDPERFLFTGGCTAALALTISDLPWQKGDVVVTSALEHHALVRPVEQLVTQRGVRHVVGPYRPGEPVDLGFVQAVVRRGGVRLVAVSHASNVTGELLPVVELARLAHEHGALFLLDAAQTVGIVPVDVRQIGADILAFAGHKGPLGPQGIGGLWAAPGVVFDSPAVACAIEESPAGCATFPRVLRRRVGEPGGRGGSCRGLASYRGTRNRCDRRPCPPSG